jgi:hypothetical protein
MTAALNNNVTLIIGMRFSKLLLLIMLCTAVVDSQVPSWLTNTSIAIGTSAVIQEPWNCWAALLL